MNHLAARELKEGGWHFTLRNKRIGCYPIGYCGECKPHATKEEAQDCYRKYLLDKRLRFWKQRDIQRKCEVCGEFTAMRADIDNGGHWVLCEQHANREEVEKLFEGVGEIWSS